jgi:CRP-like cAMP-binding protein
MVVRAGARLATQGAPSTGMWIVQRGALLAERVSDDGRRLAWLLAPGDPVGEPAGLDSPVDVTALRPCRLRAVPRGEGARELARRAHALACAAGELAWAPVPDRVCRAMVGVAERFGRPVPGGRALGLRLSQDLLAALVGSTRESVNRALQDLQRAGLVLVTGRGRYVVAMDERDPAGRDMSALGFDYRSIVAVRR